jgi:hypothetical protein
LFRAALAAGDPRRFYERRMTMAIEAHEITPGQLSGPEGKLETLRRLCKILSVVHEKRAGYSNGPCDCICPEREGSPRYWRSDGEALRWLEKFVEALPKGRVAVEVAERFRVDHYGERTYLELEVAKVGSPSESDGK